jgi:hypothetical protein
MPPTYVKVYVKRQRNDAADAICEAVTRPSMRFVPIKGEEQQGILVLRVCRQGRQALRLQPRRPRYAGQTCGCICASLTKA